MSASLTRSHMVRAEPNNGLQAVHGGLSPDVFLQLTHSLVGAE